jgi:hypothetical protein
MFGSYRSTPLVSILLQVLVCESLQVIPSMILESPINRLEDLRFKLFSNGCFPNAPTRCSVKCLKVYKLFFDLIFIVDLTYGLASTISCFCCSS